MHARRSEAELRWWYKGSVSRCLFCVLAASIWIVPISAAAQVIFAGTHIPPARVDSSVSRYDSTRPDVTIVKPDTPGERIGSIAAGPVGDLFRAGPDTYAPRFDRSSHRHGGRRHLMRGYGYVADLYAPFVGVSSYLTGRSSEAEAQAYRRPQSPNDIRSYRRDLANVDDMLKPYTPLTPAGPPKTFYVIPRCYAGDSLPRPEQLPEGCRLSDVRTVPPRRSSRP